MTSLRFVVSWVLAPLLVIGAALTGGYLVAARAGDARSSLTSALDSLPADTLVAGFTDWAAIRDALDEDGLAARRKPVDHEIGTDEAGAAGDENGHFSAF